MNNEQLFEAIYEIRIWGASDKRKYFSGPGSMEENTAKYIDFINSFIKFHDVKNVVEIGCGDWQVGSRIDYSSCKVIACDIASNLISENINLFKSENLEFRVVDIIADDLPDGEICLIRQVFQHLSNADILVALEKIKKYKYVIITDGCSTNRNEWYVNDDIPTNLFTRKRGLFLDKAPFNQSLEVALEYPTTNTNEILRTVVIPNF